MSGAEHPPSVVVSRRWTDELTPRIQALHASLVTDEPLPDERDQLLHELWEDKDIDKASDKDFDFAEIAREELQKTIDEFNETSKPSFWSQVGLSSGGKRKIKVASILKESTESDIADLQKAVEDLDEEWKKRNGTVYNAFKKICGTLDNHRSILKVFPSQNDYASPLVGSVTILMKAAKSHTEISELLSKSVAEVSDMVATCSNVVKVVRTSPARKTLAEIYSKMFGFFIKVIEWYMQSKFGRAMRSFNENLLKAFQDAKAEIEQSVNELFRKAAVANTAMTCMLERNMRSFERERARQRQYYEMRDQFAGQRMERMMQTTWAEIKHLETVIASLESALCQRPSVATESTKMIEQTPSDVPTLTPPKSFELLIGEYVSQDEGTNVLTMGRLWIPDTDLLSRVRAWMLEKSGSQTIWISSPYEPGAISGSQAAARSTLAASLQAETPMISYFCKRPGMGVPVRTGLSIEQAGLISLCYSFILQLSQFKTVQEVVPDLETDLQSLDGSASSWELSLKVLERLLDHTPLTTFCVIDGLNFFELNNGAAWTKQFLTVLKHRQQQNGVSFNILFSTSGQSMVLPLFTRIEDQYKSVKKPKDIRTVVVGSVTSII